MHPMYRARREAIRRALRLVSDSKKLALILGVSSAHVRGWVSGTGAPSANVFLKAVDIIEECGNQSPSLSKRNYG